MLKAPEAIQYLARKKRYELTVRRLLKDFQNERRIPEAAFQRFLNKIEVYAPKSNFLLDALFGESAHSEVNPDIMLSVLGEISLFFDRALYQGGNATVEDARQSAERSAARKNAQEIIATLYDSSYVLEIPRFPEIERIVALQEATKRSFRIFLHRPSYPSFSFP